MSASPYSLQALTRRRPWASSTDSLHSHHPQPDTSNGQNVAHSGTTMTPTSSLHRKLGLVDLIFYGVGCSVGAGIYSLVGIGAHRAGPAVAASFALCGVACAFTSLAYAEWSARIPLAGSAYVFCYVAFGEIWAWLVGWNLTLGYSVSAAVVARSWAEYVVGFFGKAAQFSDNLEQWTTKVALPGIDAATYTCCPLAMVIVALCTAVLVTGAKESTRFNTAMTILNLSVLALVWVLAGTTDALQADNLTPFLPHGWTGMAQGAGLVFFSYLGFDMVACLSEEVKHPERNMPVGIVGSLLVTMAIYVVRVKCAHDANCLSCSVAPCGLLVATTTSLLMMHFFVVLSIATFQATSIAVVGMAPEPLLGDDTPITNALLANACCTHAQQQLSIITDGMSCVSYASCSMVRSTVLYMSSRLVSVGAMFGLTTATFACLMGQPRIFYSMAQDGLLFPIYKRVSPRTGVPTQGTLLTGIFTAVVACLIDLETLSSAISLGTLQVFTFVNAGIILVRTSPGMEPEADLHVTGETAPLLPVVPPIPPSPLVRDPKVAAVMRSLGLVKQTSLRIRASVRGSRFSVEINGSKPVWLVVVFTLSAVVASAVLSSNTHNSFFCQVMAVLGLVLGGTALALCRLPQSPPPATFCCPAVPVIPLAGILCNAYMMGSMPASTWMVIIAWMGVGLMFYLVYGVHHSNLSKESASSASETLYTTTNESRPVASSSSYQSSI